MTLNDSFETLAFPAVNHFNGTIVRAGEFLLFGSFIESAIH